MTIARLHQLRLFGWLSPSLLVINLGAARGTDNSSPEIIYDSHQRTGDAGANHKLREAARAVRHVFR